MVVRSWWRHPDDEPETDEAVEPIPSPPYEEVIAEPKSEFGKATLAIVTVMLLGGAWLVVGFSLFIISKMAESYGVSPQTGRMLAFPAILVPLWKTIVLLRRPSMERALTGHLWVVNGAAVWAVLVLAGLWWIRAWRDAMSGSQFGMMVVVASVGFWPLFGALIAFNYWLFKRQRQ